MLRVEGCPWIYAQLSGLESLNPLTDIDVLGHTGGMETRTLPARQKNMSCCAGVEPASLSAEQRIAAALVARALGDETRLRLLDLLAQQPAPLCVCDLTPLFPQHQPTISHHLRLLREAGLIETERRGIWSYYWATPRGRRCLAAIADLD